MKHFFLYEPFPFDSVHEVLLGYYGTELHQFFEDTLESRILDMSVAMALDVYNVSHDLINGTSKNYKENEDER